MGKKRLFAAMVLLGTFIIALTLTACPNSTGGDGDLPPLSKVSALAVGGAHTVALKSDGTVWAWGWNQYGQLGDGTSSNRSNPVQVKDSEGTAFTGVSAIAAGGSHTVALKSDGTVWAWGLDEFGQLGTGFDSNTPVQVKGSGGIGFLTGVSAVAAGGEYTVALKSDGTVCAWGSNGSGQLGDGTTILKGTPVQVKDWEGPGYLTNIITITAGNYHTMALELVDISKPRESTLFAWGRNYHLQLGDGTTDNKTAPVKVKDAGGSGYLTGITAIAAGGSHTVALESSIGSTVWAWGSNEFGQLGDEIISGSSIPVQVKGAGSVDFTSVSSVAAGNFHSVALKFDENNVPAVWTWGSNEFGQLGDGTNINKRNPVQVRGSAGVGFLTGVSAIAAGYNHTVAVKSDGTVWAWGRNYHGQLGDGSQVDRNIPVQVNIP